MMSEKKSLYIDSNSYISVTDESNFSYTTLYSEIPDAIRYFSKNYWTVNEENIVYANDISTNTMFSIIHDSNGTIILEANKNKFTSDNISETGILERQFDSAKWEIFLNNNLPEDANLYEENTFRFIEPVDLFQNNRDSQKNILYIKKDYKYNFYSPKYESTINDISFNSNLIPSITSLIEDKNLGTRTYEENLLLTLGGTIQDNYAESLMLATEYNDTVKQYFDKYAESYNNPDTRAVFEAIGYRSNTIKINSNQTSLMKDVSFIPFPFYNIAEFSNLASDKESLIHKLNNFRVVKDELFSFMDTFSDTIPTKNFIYNSEYSQQYNLKEYDVRGFITSAMSGTLFTGDVPQQATAETISNLKNVTYTNFISYINKNYKNKKREYKDLNSPINDKELICYKIEKRQFGYERGSPLQTFWITPDSSDIINFIDTQIKYGTEYYYTIYAYVMVVGNRYSYSKYDYSGPAGELNRLSDVQNGLWRLKINNSAAYKIFEVPYVKFSSTINEDPYTKPVAYFSKDNDKIRISLQPSENSSLEEIKIIENRDFKTLESIRLSQNNVEKDKIRCYGPNDSNKTLEIYKVSTRPTDFIAFQGKLYKTIISENDKSFLDTLIPDIKYYYMFRYLNKHGVPSNVSIIHEVIMKNEDGYLYLETKTIDLEKEAEKSIIKDFKRYLLVRPSIIQTQINKPPRSNNINNVTLGPSDDSVWNKDFVLRITSKKTNRVLDFNIKTKIKR